jgi:Zn ribbon nucleic-acid-binding protein
MGVYRQRKPQYTAYYKALLENYSTMLEQYPQRYNEQYGFFRPEIGKEVGKYLKCGIPKYGFARVKCQNKSCGTEYILPFSCKGRGCCPSCQQKYSLEMEEHLVNDVLLDVPHRHMIFTIPKRLRKNFYWHRECLNDLSRFAWQVIKSFMKETLGVEAGVPAAVQSIETTGQYLDLNPHVHAIVTDGLFLPDGAFRPMPKYGEGARICIQAMWEKHVSNFCVKQGFVTKDFMTSMLMWKYTGFSVYTETRVVYRRGNKKSEEIMRHLIRYISKPPVAMSRVKYEGHQVLYRGNFHKGHKANFRIFDPVDFVAAVTSHIPNHRQKYINAYGLYSNRTRGTAKKKGEDVRDIGETAVASPEQRNFKKTWAMLIKKVWEVDPMECPDCGHQMKVVAVIDDRQGVERLLRRMGLWEDVIECRGPPELPATLAPVEVADDIELVPVDDDWGPGE